ncbi:MAG TPA: hypothetical protein VHN16_05720 [Streptosporangiaceae bacterium]|jgi:fructose-bisphosphate aldolase class 1|nr:hypothetical protein [Streptosporangiaceae bacterium]
MAALLEVAASMVAPGKGVLAADERIGIVSERLTEGPAANCARAGAASQAARGTGAGADG